MTAMATTSLAIPVITDDMATLEAGLAYAAAGLTSGRASEARSIQARHRRQKERGLAETHQPRHPSHHGMARRHRSQPVHPRRPVRPVDCGCG